MSTCRFGHPILVDNYCEFGHIRPIDKPTDEKWNDPRTGPEFDNPTTGEICPNCGRPLDECHGNCIFKPEKWSNQIESMAQEVAELRTQLAAERKTTENLRVEAKQNWKLIDQLREQQ